MKNQNYGTGGISHLDCLDFKEIGVVELNDEEKKKIEGGELLTILAGIATVAVALALYELGCYLGDKIYHWIKD